MKRVSIFIALVVIGGWLTVTNPVWAECSANNWKDCTGKPWADGNVMETPLGSKWWPHHLWGTGDEAGSTNWYSKPEVVLRALA